MHPFLYQTQSASGTPFQIPTYGTLILLAFTAAFALINARARKVGIAPERLVPIYGSGAIFGLLGAHVLFVIGVDGLVETLTHPWNLLVFNGGGLAAYGGLIGGALGVIGAIRWLGLPFWKTLDLVAPAWMLGNGIGRMGCFFAGCCNGAVAHLSERAVQVLKMSNGDIWFDSRFPFVALEFHHGSMSNLLDQPLYPTELWSAGSLFLMFAGASLVWAKKKFDGQVAGFVLLLEPVFRCLIESFRADERGYFVKWHVASVPAWLPPGFSQAGAGGVGDHVVGLTTSQGLGVLLILVGGAILLARRNEGVAPELELAEEI